MPYTFERSPDTDAVINILQGCNQEISYGELASRAGLSPERVKSILPTARTVLRKTGVLFGCIRGYGLNRLTDADKVKKPEAFKRRVVRGAGREIKDLTTISAFDKLSKVEQHNVTLNRTILGAIRQSAAVKPTREAPPMASAPLPNAASLIAQHRMPGMTTKERDA